jgi:hypothetical protein
MRPFARLISLLALAILVLPAGAGARPARQVAERCFPETGQCLGGAMLRFWEQHGGLPVFGYPIGPATDEVSAEDGRTYRVQWLERARFELHPENQAPYDVLLGRLGDGVLHNRGVAWASVPGQQNIPAGCLGFPTRHSLCNTAVVGRDVAVQTGFRDYWETHGLRDPARDAAARSLALLGMPLTEPLVETNSSGVTVLAQYFERARLERTLTVSPDGAQAQPGPLVLQGRLGAELRASRLPVQTLDSRYAETQAPIGVVADELGLAWSAVEGRTSIVVAADPDGGNRRILAADPDGVKELVGGGQHLYWLSGTGVRRVLREGGPIEALATFDALTAHGLIRDSEALYWVQPEAGSEGSLVISLPLSGGEPRAVTGDLWRIHALATDGLHLYWANSHLEVKRAPRGGGTPEFVYATRGAADRAALALAGDTVYVAFDGASVLERPQADGLVLAVGKGDRSSARVLDEARATALAADGERLYWTTAPGEVRAAPLTGGAPETLVAGQSRPAGLAATSRGLFWSNLQPVATPGGASVGALLHAPLR